MKNLFSIFDQNIVVDTKSEVSHNYKYSMSKYAFKDIRDNMKMIAFWYDGEKPGNQNYFKLTDISVTNLELNQPIVLNLLDGKFYEIPMDKWTCEDNRCKFIEIPVLDSPMIILDKESELFQQ